MRDDGLRDHHAKITHLFSIAYRPRCMVVAHSRHVNQLRNNPRKGEQTVRQWSEKAGVWTLPAPLRSCPSVTDLHFERLWSGKRGVWREASADAEQQAGERGIAAEGMGPLEKGVSKHSFKRRQCGHPTRCLAGKVPRGHAQQSRTRFGFPCF